MGGGLDRRHRPAAALLKARVAAAARVDGVGGLCAASGGEWAASRPVILISNALLIVVERQQPVPLPRGSQLRGSRRQNTHGQKQEMTPHSRCPREWAHGHDDGDGIGLEAPWRGFSGQVVR